MRFTSIVILYFILISGFVQAQSTKEVCHYTLHIDVTDAETGKSLSGVTLEFNGEKLQTSNEGHTTFKNVCAGNYSLAARFAGYKDTLIQVRIDVSKDIELNLHPTYCEVHEVEVLGKKQVEDIQAKEQLSGIELRKYKGSSLGEMLQTLPGVQAVQSGPTVFKPMILGMTGMRVLLLNQGIRMEGQQWGSEHAPEVDPFLYDKISVIKGASAVLYGAEAIGGVVLLEPSSLKKMEGFSGDVHLQFAGVNSMASGALRLAYAPTFLPGLKTRGHISYRRGGNVRTPDAYMGNTGLEDVNFSWNVGYFRNRFSAEIFYSQYRSTIGILSRAHIGNLTDLYKAIAYTGPDTLSNFTYDIGLPKQSVIHEFVKAKMQYVINDQTDITLTYGLQYNNREEYDKPHAYATADNEADMRLAITTHTIRTTINHRLLRHVYGTVGAEGMYQENIFDGRMFIPNFRNSNAGIFISEKYTKGTFEAELGMRLDYRHLQSFYYKNNVYQNPIREFVNFSAGLGISKQWNSAWQMAFYAGTAFRPPHVSELYSNGLHHGAASIEIGNTDLPSENAYHAHWRNQWNLFGIQVAGTFYYTYFNPYIYLVPKFPATLTIKGAFPTFEYSAVRAGFTGGEVQLVDTLWAHLEWKASVSLLDARNYETNTVLINTPAQQVDAGWKLFTNLGKKYPVYLQSQYRYVFQKTGIPEGQDYSAAPAGYFLMDASMGMQIPIGKRTAEWQISVSNLLNQKYRSYLNRFRYFTDEAGINVRIMFHLNF